MSLISRWHRSADHTPVSLAVDDVKQSTMVFATFDCMASMQEKLAARW